MAGIISFDQPVVLIGDGLVDVQTLHGFAHLPLIAMDGGAEILAQEGLVPSLVTGDFDSISPETLAAIPQEKRLRLDDQDHCDFEKTLMVIDAPKIYALGVTGDRVDHTLEALRIVSQYWRKRIEVITPTECIFHWPQGAHREMEIGKRISFFAFAPSFMEVSFGLEYPLDDLELGAGRMSLSNRVEEAEVAISYQAAPLIAILER